MKQRYTINGDCLNKKPGKLSISPADRFILNFHNDGRPRKDVKLRLENITVENHTVTINNKIKVVEHLFSALYGLNIFNIKIDFYSKEIPFFDGSSLSFVKILKSFPDHHNPQITTIDKEVCIKNGDSFIKYEPAKNNELIIEMELEHPFIGIQKINLTFDRDTYIKEIAPARTFVFTDDSDPRIKNLPPYGIGITKTRIYSNEPLRFPDEPLRHKILDLLGDLYLLQRRISGKITARNPSHLLNIRFARAFQEYHQGVHPLK